MHGCGGLGEHESAVPSGRFLKKIIIKVITKKTKGYHLAALAGEPQRIINLGRLFFGLHSHPGFMPESHLG